jgi:FixJ family two-component response regulator
LAVLKNALVHVIDDDAALRKAIARLFASAKIEALFHESVHDFLSKPLIDQLGCIVSDVRMPGINGLVFQSQLDELGIKLPIVIMTGFGDVAMSVRAMKAGAIDFLIKPFNSQYMLDAVATALQRDRTRRDIEGYNQDLVKRYSSLSSREKQVLALVVSGRLNKQIAGDLDLKEVTVKVHRGAVMRKMGAYSLAELVLLAQTIGIQMGSRPISLPRTLAQPCRP